MGEAGPAQVRNAPAAAQTLQVAAEEPRFDRRVHVVDEDHAVRDALTHVFTAAGMPVRTYASAEAFLEAVETLAEGCVLTDVHLPAMSGLDLLRRLGNRRESFPVIVLTGQADVATAVDAIKLGAVDFIEKPFDQEALLGATRGVLRRLAAASDARRLRADYAARLATLAPREQEVLEGLIAGGSNKAVAQELGISPRTVDIHRSKIMMKMRADSFSDLVRMVVQARGA